MDHIYLTLDSRDYSLAVGINESGVPVVPLKQVADIFGIDWRTQKRKVKKPSLIKRFGTCVISMQYGRRCREVICIRLDRVAAFVHSINPRCVGGQGAVDCADAIADRQQVLDRLLNDYEQRDAPPGSMTSQKPIFRASVR